MVNLLLVSLKIDLACLECLCECRKVFNDHWSFLLNLTKKIFDRCSTAICDQKCTEWPCPVFIQQLHWTILMEKLRPIQESLFSVFEHTFSNAHICILHARRKNFSNKLFIEWNYSNMFFFRPWSNIFVELANVHYTSPQDISRKLFWKVSELPTFFATRYKTSCSVMSIQQFKRLRNNMV